MIDTEPATMITLFLPSVVTLRGVYCKGDTISTTPTTAVHYTSSTRVAIIVRRVGFVALLISETGRITIRVKAIEAVPTHARNIAVGFTSTTSSTTIIG